MHFLLFEDLARSPQRELNKISNFLGVSQFGELQEQHANDTVMPLFPISLYLAKNIAGSDSVIYKLTRKVNLELASLFPARKPTIPNDLASHLSGVFSPYNKRLAELTGLDLSAWRTPSF